MPRFDVRRSTTDGLPVVVVRCPECFTQAEHPFSSVDVGADVSCAACGRRILVTPDNLAWIRSRADMVGVPDQRPFSDGTSAAQRSVSDKPPEPA